MTTCKLIAELGANHQGSMEIAVRMIEEAAAAGCWGVKIQKRDIEAFSEGLKYMPRNERNSFGPNYYEHRKALELSLEDIDSLRTIAKGQGLAFIASVFDIRSADEMAEIGVECLKLPSQLLTSYHLCRHLITLQRKHDFTMAASTGMHSEAEVEDWQYRSAFDVLFYCRSLYPAEIGEVDLAKMRILRTMITNRQQLGYSSHDRAGKAIPFAVALGAEYIERHFTLDKTMKGSDHATVSSEPEEMREIVRSIEYAEAMLGSDTAPLPERELKVRKVYRGF
jgi:sialic acid synthase